MKIQNIAAMLDEEGIERNNNISALSGVTTGQFGRRTDWETVSRLAKLEQNEFIMKCKNIILSSKP